MVDLIFSHEPALRLGVFLGGFALLALAEWRWPRRPRQIGRARRWPGNLGIVVIDTLLLRLIFPAAAVGLAVLVEARGWGLLQSVSLPYWVTVVVSVLLLDLLIYFQHVLFHAVPLLWRLHRMHHADLELDVSTGLRFHPLEILLSMLLKLAAVAALGAPALGVLIFEVLLNATSMFNHSNLFLPQQHDRWLRRLLVTPDMHRVHHSIHRLETDSNFGFNLSCWDRLFGTYRAQPRDGHLGMTLGLSVFRSIGDSRLDRLLWQPLRREGSDPDDSHEVKRDSCRNL